VCVALYALSFVVQLVVWQNNLTEITAALAGTREHYRNEARYLARGDVATFVTGPNPPSNAEVLSHPPGYPMVLAAVFSTVGESETAIGIVQIALNSLGSVLIFLIALELFNLSVAFVAGVLASLSPQIAYNSVMMLPEVTATIPILLAIYLLIKARDKPEFIYAICCGALIGLSCWFRANGMFLAVFAGVLALVVIPLGRRLKFSLLLVTAAVLVISPMTVRNAIIFERFIPIGLGAGINLIEGIGDYDTEKRFSVAATDQGVRDIEVVEFGRPDYRHEHYNPDGVEREAWRTKRAVEIIKSDPVWFAGVVLHRSTMNLRLERVPQTADRHGDLSSGLPYYLNAALRVFQRAFITAIFLPLILIGVGLMLYRRECRGPLAILLTVPIYYMAVHSILHTEYRYIVASQYFLLTLAAVAIVAIAGEIKRVAARRFGANRESET